MSKIGIVLSRAYAHLDDVDHERYIAEKQKTENHTGGSH
jgi:hypothetical protein